MLVSYYGQEIKCSNCGAHGSFEKVHTTYLWANQHGGKLRIFCHVCTQIEDIKGLHGEFRSREVVRAGIPF